MKHKKSRSSRLQAVSGILYLGRGRRKRLYLRSDDGREHPVGPKQGMPVFPGDRVRAELHRPEWAVFRRGRRPVGDVFEAQVIEVTERTGGVVLGRYHASRMRAWISPKDAEAVMPVEVQVRPDIPEGAMVAVELGKNPAMISGKIVMVWENPDDPRAVLEQVIYEKDLPREFPGEVLREAGAFSENIPADERARRTDLTRLPVVVIDPADAKDHDDGVSWEPRPGGGGRLGVHIADVSWFVRPGSALDAEAIARGVSVYLPDRVLPMLPPRLSADLCSLLEGKERLARTVFLDIDSGGVVQGGEACESVIKPAAGLSYEEVWAVIGGGEGRHPLEATLKAMDAVATKMRERRFREGSLDFDLPETKVNLGANGEPETVTLKKTNRSHWLIEEFMIAANEFTGHALAKKGLGIWRVHEPPDLEDISELDAFLEGFGVKFRRGTRSSDVSPQELQAILGRFRGTREEYVVHRKVLQAMKLARYSELLDGHFGLALEAYTHFTSPIRRYADLVVHRLLAGREDGRYTVRRLGEVAQGVSLLERRATDAERECIRLMILRYLAGKLGQVFEGTVSRVENMGAFIELDGMGLEGLLRNGEMSPEAFRISRDRMSMRGGRSGMTVHVGQRVRVVLARVDRENRQVDLALEG
jgi:ribonuclease R